MKKTNTPTISEKLFQQRIVQGATVCGWLVYHTFDSRRSARGFPDLVLVHPRRKRVMFIEVKTEIGKVAPMQQIWIDALVAAGQEACIVRPADWDDWLWDSLRRG